MVQPDVSQAFEEAFSLHERGLLQEAQCRYEAILVADGRHFECLHFLGVLYAQRGRLADSLGLLRRALEQDPASADAHNHAGSVLHGLNRHDEAIAHFDQALAIDPEDAEAHYNRGTALSSLGRYIEAIAAYEAALAIEPKLPAARYNLGAALQALDRNAAAIDQYKRALAIEPNYRRAHLALGNGLQALGRNAEAVAHFEKAIALDPNDADVYNNLGLALQELNRAKEAITHHQKAIDLRPDFAAAHNNLGRALQALNRHDEAIAQYRQATSLGPPEAARYGNLGLALQEIGRLQEACRAFEVAIGLAPRTGRFYRNLADCKRFTEGEPQIAAMQKLLGEAVSLPEADRRQLLFALGKALADIGHHERAFSYLLEGNALKRRDINYDEARVLEGFARIQAVFTPDLINCRQGVGNCSSIPIFIVGMPRSGTTLVEQILASHSKVFGAGELLDFGGEVARVGGRDAARFPEVVPSLSREELHQIGARYLDRVMALAPVAQRITDKMPLNFFFVGLIHLVLPSARIIHTRRDPLDTCFSCFATLFTGDHRVAYELGELGRYYRAYEGMMEHWRRVLPGDVMLEVDYEDLIADFDRQARGIVAYCGLEWEDACANFSTTRRPVRTASAAQVRQPIYRSSIGRARPYRHLLGPLIEALGEDPSR